MQRESLLDVARAHSGLARGDESDTMMGNRSFPHSEQGVTACVSAISIVSAALRAT